MVGNISNSHLMKQLYYISCKAMGVTLLACGKINCLIGVTTTGLANQTVYPDTEHLLFQANIDTLIGPFLKTISDNIMRMAFTTANLFFSFLEMINNCITFVFVLCALIAMKAKCVINIAGIHFLFFLNTKVMKYQLFLYISTRKSHDL